MSPIDIKSPKHCGNKTDNFTIENKLRFIKKNNKFFYTITTLLISILSLIFLVWLTLHPTKPHFSLTQADLYQLNLSGFRLNSSIQITLLSNNPNRKVGIFYDETNVYASYKGQQITLYTSISPFYQGHEEVNVLSASLAANGLPVAPYLGYEVQRDRIVGKIVLVVKVNGKLRWKVGSWVSGKYRYGVDCVALLMPFGGSVVVPSGPLIARQGTQCSTTI